MTAVGAVVPDVDEAAAAARPPRGLRRRLTSWAGGASVADVDTETAALRWAQTWQRAWPEHDAAAIAALYAEGAAYRSSPFREPEAGGARGFVARAFPDESEVRCRFGSPMVGGARAAVEWWASMREGGEETALAGTTVLVFDSDGLVVEHVDYWRQAEGRRDPYAGWAGDA